MMKIKSKKNGQKKLLAAVAVFAMVACVFAAVPAVSDDADAASNTITYLNGAIYGDSQPFTKGSIGIMNGDLVVEENKKLLIMSGAEFEIQSGFTLTIKKGAILFVENGARFLANGNIVVEEGGKIVNKAMNNGSSKVNGKFTGFFIEGNVTMEKGSEITGISEGVDIAATSASAPADSTDMSGITTAVGSVDAATGESAGTISLDHKTTGIVKITGSDISYHMNGIGNYGYWVGFSINVGAADKSVTFDIDGRKVKDTSDASSLVYYWTTAGMISNVTISGADITTMNFCVDASGVNANNGQLVLGKTATMEFQSKSKTPSEITNQVITMTDGSSVELKALVSNVIVESQNSKYSIGASVTINASGSPTTITDLVFGAISEKVDVAVDAWDPAKKVESSKFNYNILNVSGDIGEGNALDINESINVKALLFDDEKYTQTSATAPVRGIVQIASGSELIVGEGATITIEVDSILDVVGSFKTAGDKDEGKKATVNAYGIMTVSGTVDIGNVNNTDNKNTVIFNINSNEAPDYATLTAYVIIEGDGAVNIVGYAPTPDVWDNAPKGTLGVVYITDEAYVITSLNNALATEGVDEIYIWGYPASVNDQTNPVGDMLANYYVIDKDITFEIEVFYAYKVFIAEGVTVTISENGEMSAAHGDSADVIIVEGTLIDYTMTDLEAYPGNNNGAIGGTAGELYIDAEVKSVDADETYYMYTTLKNALSEAVPGDVIGLFCGADVEGTLVIPEGVYLKTLGKDLLIGQNSELIVNGTLDVMIDTHGNEVDEYGSIYIEQKTDNYNKNGKLTINNLVVAPEDNILSITVAGVPEESAYYVPGIYTVSGTIDVYEELPMVLNIAVAATIADAMERPTVEAPTVGGEVTFNGGDAGNTLYVDADLTVDEITIANYTINVANNAVFNGIVSGANGSMGLCMIAAAEEAQITITDVIDEDGTDILSIYGAPIMIDKDGASTINDEDNVASIELLSGTVNVLKGLTLDVTNLNSFSIAKGTTLQIDGAAASVIYKTLIVDGTVNVLNGAGLTSATEDDANVGILTILGTVNVMVASNSSEVDGSITALDVYLGLTKENISKTVAGEATLTGKATVTGLVYVLNGAVISENMIKDKDYTEFYIEKVLWMTVYSMGTSKVKVDNAPVENAYFGGWLKENGEDAEDTNGDITIAENNMVFADIKYDIYEIQLIADEGIANVSIDGNLMLKGMFETSTGMIYGFTAILAAGEHEIQYTLQNGWSGQAILTVDGEKVTGLKFTTEGDFDPAGNIYQLQLSGIEKTGYVPDAPETGDDGMSLTEILLIVLVVLILIMAIIVAMRLMRS